MLFLSINGKKLVHERLRCTDSGEESRKFHNTSLISELGGVSLESSVSKLEQKVERHIERFQIFETRTFQKELFLLGKIPLNWKKQTIMMGKINRYDGAMATS